MFWSNSADIQETCLVICSLTYFFKKNIILMCFFLNWLHSEFLSISKCFLNEVLTRKIVHRTDLSTSAHARYALSSLELFILFSFFLWMFIWRMNRSLLAGELFTWLPDTEDRWVSSTQTTNYACWINLYSYLHLT